MTVGVASLLGRYARPLVAEAVGETQGEIDSLPLAALTDGTWTETVQPGVAGDEDTGYAGVAGPNATTCFVTELIGHEAGLHLQAVSGGTWSQVSGALPAGSTSDALVGVSWVGAKTWVAVGSATQLVGSGPPGLTTSPIIATTGAPIP
jgi:hypothetical protein